MKNISCCLLLLICFLFVSCKSTILSIYIKNQNIYRGLKVLENKETNQTIVFFPMVHVGKVSYYEDCKKIIDSLRYEGFTFYYESVRTNPKLDSVQASVYNKKVRSILGYNPLNVSSNESLPKHYKKKNFVLQDYNLMGITKADINLDLHKNQIIDSIEKKYGAIVLNNCDFEIGDLEKYDCKSDNKKYSFHFSNVFRDPYIAKEILKKKDKKIAMIYGKMHWSFIYPTLNKNGFEIVKGKI